MNNTSRRLRIALISPFLSGYYLGDLVNNIRILSMERDFDLLTLQTRNFTVFDIPLALNNIDGVILLIDAVTPGLANKIIQLGIPVISIGKDYFPLHMEVVLIDNKQGVYQVMDHLTELGHKRIGFSGDVSIYDISQRYNAYLQYLEEHNLGYDPNIIFNTNNTFFQGGAETADEFRKRGNPCTAIVFSTDLNAIGFQDKISAEGLKIPEDVAITGFDNIYLTQLKTPQITSIAQNLKDIALYAVDRVLNKINGDAPVKNPRILPCRLIARESTTGIKKIEQKEIKKELDFIPADYIDGILANNYEAVKSVVLGQSNDIFSLTPLFGPFLNWGCYARWNNSEDPETLEIDRIFCGSGINIKGLPKKGDIFNQQNFPPESMYHLCLKKNNLITVLPIAIENKKWGVLVLAGKAEEETSFSNYSMFTNYLDLLAFGMEKETLLKEVLIREQTTKSLTEELEIVSKNATDGIWIWDLKSNLIEWNLRAINMLGFTSQTDIKAIKNIPFYERIHPDEVDEIRKKIQSHLEHGAPLRGEFRMKTKNNEYIWIFTSGEAVLDNNGIPIRIIGSVSDISERHRHQEKIKYMAFYDSLTGLPNRAMIREKLLSLIKEKKSGKLAVMLLDLDRFKYINDSYGHDAGDRLLKHTSETISSVLRQQDFFARFGGDEFVLICPIENVSESGNIGDRILKKLRKPYRDETGFEFFITGSIGVTIYPKHSTNPDELIKNADIAMYKAKQSGKNQLTIFHGNMDETIQDRVNLENQLRKAEKDKEFLLYIQPQYAIDSGELTGGEVLMRWKTEELGWISPTEFIPLAEEIGIIISIGSWVLNESCLMLKKWQILYGTKIKLSVNISAEQILNRKLLKDVKNALEISNLSPEFLCLEITESTAISDFEYTKKILNSLKSLGIQVSLDDFGTGYSSLSLLKELPFNELKIDKSFIPESCGKKEEWVIVQSIITMGHALGFRIVTEGIETEEQLDYMKLLDCDIAQGFYCGKPMPANDFIKLISED